MNRKIKTLFEKRSNVIYSTSGDTTIKDAVDLMNKHHIGSLVVLSKKGEIEGIFTERDVMMKLANTDDLVGHLKVKEIMTPKEKLIITDGESTIEELMVLMTNSKIRHIPVVDENEILQGVLSIRDIIRILLHDSKQKVNQLNNYITGKYPI